MNFEEKVYNTIKNSHKKILTEKDLYIALQLGTSFDMHALQDGLSNLIKEGKIVRTARGKYMLADYSSFVRAKIMLTNSGYAFARPENAGAEDIFIPDRNLGGAAHGDIVLVSKVTEQKKSKGRNNGRHNNNGRPYGNVEKIIERGYSTIVGLVTIEDGTTLVRPDDTKFAENIFIAKTDTLSAPNNSKVVVQILDYPTRQKMARGKIVEILGDALSAKVSTLSIIRSFNLVQEFPAEVVAEAKKVAVPISDEERVGRKDYTKQLVITIDGEDARDFDDAISLSKSGDNYNLSVHIADVSHYVKEGGKLDAEAYKRGTSVYFPDYVLPMLPVELSNNMCSLNPDVDRLTLSVDMVIGPNGEVINYGIHKGIIHSSYRMTYTKVTKILAGDKEMCKQYAKIVPMLKDMEKLAKLLIIRRDKAGQLDFDLPEPQIIVDEDYNTVDIVRKPREMADRLIEQFMVLTNEVVAKHFDQMNAPFVYRVHEDPTPEKISSFASFAASFGMKLNKNASPKDFQKILLESQNQPYSKAVSKVMLRSMQKARYSSEDIGHFGLALKHYCHFTSPIRRYPDLTIHRIISYYLSGSLTDDKIEKLYDKVDAAALQSSLTERNAEEAERTVDDQKKAEFMANKIGQEFDATISGASDSGVFVELDNTVEGLIFTEKLPPDCYIYDEKKFALIGKKHTYRIGDKLRVKLDQVDIVTRHINFSLAN